MPHCFQRKKDVEEELINVMEASIEQVHGIVNKFCGKKHHSAEFDQWLFNFCFSKMQVVAQTHHPEIANLMHPEWGHIPLKIQQKATANAREKLLAELTGPMKTDPNTASIFVRELENIISQNANKRFGDNSISLTE